ncbi:hypothetical protein [Geitlerinema sp. PCC 9228]|uniref:hypothetical protein n=1 Tax=Geitlerinema sp. PCC 9228 TaxID=111611 RepID=UPI0008F9B29A|nr:hypothetical protein [Geitlerinema sp. PCC 9228]
MTPNLLRQIWSLVEATQANMLLSLDDASLIDWILRNLKQKQNLDGSQVNALDSYLHAKVSLIRDLAYQKVTSRSC